MSKLLFVVEDDDFIRSDLTELLELEGYTVKSFRNGREALDASLVQVQLPNLVILDLMMPVMNGYEFLDELSKEERLKKISVLVVSANRQADTRLKSAQVRGFLSKPIDIDKFLGLVQEYLS